MILPYILLVEDEEDIREVILYNLKKKGYTCAAVPSSEEGQKQVRFRKPDLIILDIMLPGMDGFGFCSWMKNNEATQAVPVIILSARGDEADIVRGLELGADDYLQKPISPKVLIARIESVWRRVKQLPLVQAGKVEREGLVLDLDRHILIGDDLPVDLTLSEFGALELLMRRPGWVFTRRQIMEHIKGEALSATERSIDVVMVGLRKKLGERGHLITTVRGIGYRFMESE